MIPITQVLYVIYLNSTFKRIILQRSIGICPYSLKPMILFNKRVHRFDDENVLKEFLDCEPDDDNVFTAHEIECEFYLAQLIKEGYDINTFGVTRELYEKLSKTSR
jgi:hypothetical protein